MLCPGASLRSAKSWNVAKGALQAAKAQAALLGYPDDKRIEFLFAKGVDPHWGNKLSPTRFDLLIKAKDDLWPERLDMLHGILGLPTGPKRARDEKSIPRQLSFNRFVKQHPQWVSGKSFVFFRDHPAVKGKNVLIQREQIFGTCAIHAPVVLQHYLVALANEGNMPTISIPRWIRKHAPKLVLDGIVFGDGTHANQILKHILLPDSVVHECLFNEIPLILFSHGPVLLPLWAVTDEFQDFKKWRHVGASTATVTGYHAMIAVGERLSSSGKRRLLLQNWWRKNQFVEVGEDYYESNMGSHAMYVKTPQPSIPALFDTTDAVFSVSTVDGAGVAGVGCGPAGVQ
jgi:hypothetical protein